MDINSEITTLRQQVTALEAKLNKTKEALESSLLGLNNITVLPTDAIYDDLEIAILLIEKSVEELGK